jgi:two-component system, sensor histidine kinase PdtaS
MSTTENSEIRDALIDSLNRVKSVGLIHQLLYQTEDLVSVDFKEFVVKLVDHISSFATRKNLVKTIEVSKEVSFNIETTISLGLIINELLTNSFKYAFESVDNCNIEVSLINTKGEEYQLVVADNGKGLPVGFDPENSTSLGLKLVYTLNEQLSGKINYKNDDGARFTIVFLYP